MNQNRLFAVTRSLTRVPSRRDVLRGLAGVGLGLGVARVQGPAEAKKKRKKKSKKPKPNQYGCLEVGNACKNADQCCSGICQGKKCRAHSTGTCSQQAKGYCEASNPLDTLCNGKTNCLCIRSTGGSTICLGNFNCAACQKDADCHALGYPQGAACVPFSGDFACEDVCEETGGMACAVPCGVALPEPSSE